MFDLDTIGLALAFSALVVVGKTIAAIITGRLFKLSAMDTGLMASLSTGQAASTLAIAQVGVSLNLFDQEVFNAAILTVVVTAFITSYGTQFFSHRVDRPSVVEAPLGDVRIAASDLEAVMAVAGAIARTDRGVVTPYMVPIPGQLDIAKSRVLEATEATEAAAGAGHDASGEIRVDDSFAAGTLSLIEEVGASLAILEWRVSRVSKSLMFGSEIDLVGERSPIPTAAIRILRPWNRVVVFTGDVPDDWSAEDTWLAFEVARRLRSPRELEMLVFTPDPDVVKSKISSGEGIEVVAEPGHLGRVLDRIADDDLIVAPAHVASSMGALEQWRVAKELRNVSAMIIAGPHWLSIDGASVQRNLHGVVDSTQQTSTPE